MRAGILAVLCCVTACETRNGTYFDVDGEHAGIVFDQVEFFLGKDAGSATPFTPARPLTLDPPPRDSERQRLLKRHFVDSDVQTTPETKSLRYYLPADADNLSAYYALVVASRGGVVVGVGEVEKYRVLDDAAYIYDVPLVPVSHGFERWGTPDSTSDACARWTRMRDGDAVDSTYVVSRDGDRDCDGIRELQDCDDLSYCPAGSTCLKRDSACITESCDLGTCIDGVAGSAPAKTCAAQTCLPDVFCNPTDACREAGPTDEFLACAIQIGLSHTEVTLPVEAPDGALCVRSFEVKPPLGLVCAFPQIEWPPNGKIDDWMLTVVQTPNFPDTCTFVYDGPSPDDPPPEEAHVVVSVGLTSVPPRRTTFVIGFAPQTDGSPACTRAVEITPPTSSTTNPTCP